MRSALIGLALLSSGCGALAQTIVGWRSDGEPLRRESSKSIRIEVEPKGSTVARIDEKGEAVPLGTSPLTDTVTYPIEEVRRSPSVLAVVIGGAAEVGLSVGAFLLARGREECFAEDECYRTREPNKGLYASGGVALAFGIADLITAWVHGASDDEITVSEVGTIEREYVAQRAGYAEARRKVDVKREQELEIALAALPKAPPPPPPKPAHEDWVVAVMPIEGESIAEGLGDQLRVFVGQRGCKTIDRTSQERAFTARIKEAKLASYSECYDEACHIELGKALAASHILRAQLLKFGERCVLNAELIDLLQEVAVAAASSEGKCEEEGVLLMSEQVAKTLLR